ncbi:MAG: heavy-metal-associated domain-containing protein, partial [Candidatus Zixiibacteriota bacterium]
LVLRGSLGTRGKEMPQARFTFHVPDMECKHCQMKVEQAVKEVPGVRNVEVLLGDNLVKVDGEVDEKSIEEKLEKAGYKATKRE